MFTVTTEHSGMNYSGTARNAIWLTQMDDRTTAVLYYCRAYLARAANKGFADDGTYTVSTDRRYYQLESSNNGEDEGETHRL